ncbi:MAG TPA: hypothetical protein DIV52_03335 [Ruminococcaceae bacterium]|nr:hypothetical protein [Oscillospiraceae bacterium]HCS01434.1 hypothetical protein [Oscillospiraceae bacterium]
MYCAVRFFVRLYNEDAARLSPCKDELCNMTEKMQARRVQNPINGLCAVLPYEFATRSCSICGINCIYWEKYC